MFVFADCLEMRLPVRIMKSVGVVLEDNGVFCSHWGFTLQAFYYCRDMIVTCVAVSSFLF